MYIGAPGYAFTRPLYSMGMPSHACHERLSCRLSQMLSHAHSTLWVPICFDTLTLMHAFTDAFTRSLYSPTPKHTTHNTCIDHVVGNLWQVVGARGSSEGGTRQSGGGEAGGQQGQGQGGLWANIHLLCDLLGGPLGHVGQLTESSHAHSSHDARAVSDANSNRDLNKT
jgi:hypothetical protein